MTRLLRSPDFQIARCRKLDDAPLERCEQLIVPAPDGGSIAVDSGLHCGKQELRPGGRQSPASVKIANQRSHRVGMRQSRFVNHCKPLRAERPLVIAGVEGKPNLLGCVGEYYRYSPRQRQPADQVLSARHIRRRIAVCKNHLAERRQRDGEHFLDRLGHPGVDRVRLDMPCHEEAGMRAVRNFPLPPVEAGADEQLGCHVHLVGRHRRALAFRIRATPSTPASQTSSPRSTM